VGTYGTFFTFIMEDVDALELEIELYPPSIKYQELVLERVLVKL